MLLCIESRPHIFLRSSTRTWWLMRGLELLLSFRSGKLDWYSVVASVVDFIYGQSSAPDYADWFCDMHPTCPIGD